VSRKRRPLAAEPFASFSIRVAPFSEANPRAVDATISPFLPYDTTAARIRFAPEADRNLAPWPILFCRGTLPEFLRRDSQVKLTSAALQH
jgi:hypothetical protein